MKLKIIGNIYEIKIGNGRSEYVCSINSIIDDTLNILFYDQGEFYLPRKPRFTTKELGRNYSYTDEEITADVRREFHRISNKNVNIEIVNDGWLKVI